MSEHDWTEHDRAGEGSHEPMFSLRLIGDSDGLRRGVDVRGFLANVIRTLCSSTAMISLKGKTFVVDMACLSGVLAGVP